MVRSAAKELLHVLGWLARVDEIVLRGEDSYLADDLLQEAGDSLMKLGEAANRLSRMNVLATDDRRDDPNGRQTSLWQWFHDRSGRVTGSWWWVDIQRRTEHRG